MRCIFIFFSRCLWLSWHFRRQRPSAYMTCPLADVQHLFISGRCVRVAATIKYETTGNFTLLSVWLGSINKGLREKDDCNSFFLQFVTANVEENTIRVYTQIACRQDKTSVISAMFFKCPCHVLFLSISARFSAFQDLHGSVITRKNFTPFQRCMWCNQFALKYSSSVVGFM